MKNDNFFAESVLHVVASENIDVSHDLELTSEKTIAELLDEEKETEKEIDQSTK